MHTHFAKDDIAVNARLQDRTALVTGSTDGIGVAIARALATEGAHVVVSGRDTTRGEEVAKRIEAGAANVNDAMINYTVLELPMGGAKASGSGLG